MNQPPELNSKDIRTVSCIFAVAVVVICLVLLWASRTISAQEKPSNTTLWRGTTTWKTIPVKPTGIILRKCRTVTVLVKDEEDEHILAGTWADKDLTIPVANPLVCNYKGNVKFYIMPSQDYEIEVTKPEAR